MKYCYLLALVNSSFYLAIRVAVRLYGTLVTQWSFGGADSSPKLHHGLVEVSWSLRVHQHISKTPEMEQIKGRNDKI